jgi:hypothetical protein
LKFTKQGQFTKHTGCQFTKQVYQAKTGLPKQRQVYPSKGRFTKKVYHMQFTKQKQFTKHKGSLPSK